MASDRHANPIQPGDYVIIRAYVKSVLPSDDNLNTTLQLVNIDTNLAYNPSMTINGKMLEKIISENPLIVGAAPTIIPFSPGSGGSPVPPFVPTPQT